MAPKGRWGKKEAKEPKAERLLPVRHIHHELPDAVCEQIENFFTIAECEKYVEIMKSEIDWQRQEITVSKLDGRVIEGTEPRLTTFMAEPDVCYEYSRRDNVGTGWHPSLLQMKEKAERACVECGLEPVIFNCAQMNRYEGPRHTLGMHADNEPDLLRNAPIASCSFGATREFRIMRRDDESKKWSLNLTDGCFMVMGGEMQRFYLHGVPAGGDHALRINVTFRVAIPRRPLAELHAQAGAAETQNSPAPAAPKARGFRGYRSRDQPPAAAAVQQVEPERPSRAREDAPAVVGSAGARTGWDD